MQAVNVCEVGSRVLDAEQPLAAGSRRQAVEHVYAYTCIQKTAGKNAPKSLQGCTQGVCV